MPAAAFSIRLYLLFKDIQGIGHVGSSDRIIHLADVMPRVPRLSPCSRLWAIKDCPTAHWNFS